MVGPNQVRGQEETSRLLHQRTRGRLHVLPSSTQPASFHEPPRLGIPRFPRLCAPARITIPSYINMPKRRQPTANLFQTDVARAVNSQMVRSSRSRKEALPDNLTSFNAPEPRQVRSILKQDVKDARHRMIESAASAAQGKRLFWADADLRRQRHTACGSATGKKALRFLTEGSRDLSSNVLPGCYYDPKGSRIRKGTGLAVPLIRRHYTLPKSR